MVIVINDQEFWQMTELLEKNGITLGYEYLKIGEREEVGIDLIRAERDSEDFIKMELLDWPHNDNTND